MELPSRKRISLQHEACHALMTLSSTLIQESLAHFQSQDSVSVQAHLARTFYQQSLTFEAEGVKVMAKAMQAAARDTWIGVREARGHIVPNDSSSPLTKHDFDGEIEFWYR